MTSGEIKVPFVRLRLAELSSCTIKDNNFSRLTAKGKQWGKFLDDPHQGLTLV